MSGFNKITADAFEKLQFGAGIVCKTFDPAKPAAVADENILFATSGGIKFEAKPTYTDYGEDIDNCPKNMKELKRLDSWEATLSGTALTIDTASATQVTGAADASGNKVTPRNDVKLGRQLRRGRLRCRPPHQRAVNRRLQPADRRQGEGPVSVRVHRPLQHRQPGHAAVRAVHREDLDRCGPCGR